MKAMISVEQAMAERYSFTAIASGDGWDIVFPDLPGCSSWSPSWEQIGAMAHEATRLHITSFAEDGLLAPAPTDQPMPKTAAFEAIEDPLADLVTSAELARIYGVTPRRITAIAKSRGLKGRKIGQSIAYATAAIPLFKPQRRGRPVRLISELSAAAD